MSEETTEFRLRQVGDRLEQRERHFLADDGGRLEQPLVLRWQAVDPGREDGVDGRRHLDAFDGFGETIGPAFADQGPGLDEGPHALLQKERITLSPRDQKPREGLELNVGPEERPEQLAGARRWQRVDPELRVVCPAAPGMLVLGAVVHEEEEAGDRHAGQEAVEKGLALTVHPVKVLEDQQQRLYLALPQQQALPGLECAPSALRRG